MPNLERRHGRLIGLAASLAAGLAHPVVADDTLLKLAPSPLAVPLRIGPLVGNPEGNTFEQAGLGTAYGYGAPGALLTVYIYDADEKDLADGPDTIPVCQQFESAKQGVSQSYADAKLVSERLVRLLPPEDTPLMREAMFEYTHRDKKLISYVWISAVAKHFVKLRFTVDAALRDEMPDARRAVLAAFGDAIRPHLVPVDGNAKKRGSTIGISADMANNEDVAGMLYTMFLSSVADDHPELAPVCGGAVVPPFETEISLFRALFIKMGAEDSRFAQQVLKVEAAGYLEEFLWVEFHRQSWGSTAPEDLTLPEYKAWKKKNLKRFKAPALGTVSLGYPRPLPLEPR